LAGRRECDLSGLVGDGDGPGFIEEAGLNARSARSSAGQDRSAERKTKFLRGRLKILDFNRSSRAQERDGIDNAFARAVRGEYDRFFEV